jgi:hypothetical protein
MQDHKKCHFGATQSRSLLNLYREVNSRYHAETIMEHKHCHRAITAQVKRIPIPSMIHIQMLISSRVDVQPTKPPEIQGTRPQQTRTTAEIRDGDGVGGWPATAAVGNQCNLTNSLPPMLKLIELVRLSSCRRYVRSQQKGTRPTYLTRLMRGMVGRSEITECDTCRY